MNTNSELLYKIALTLIPQIGPVQAKILLQHCEPEEIFNAKRSFLEKIEGIGTIRADAIKNFHDLTEAEEELKFIEKHSIQPLFISDPDYPKRLLNCYDSPTLLYYKGTADLNADRIIAVIGTRRNTDHGRQLTEKLIQELADHSVMVISGLAFGIDSIAHRSSLKNNLRTVAVVAHGLDQLYPPENSGLAKEILYAGGGLLTEFRSGSKPDRHNFPSRNRIVAGMSDATIVVETDKKGGSMITAELADGYNRDVFTFPGRITDSKSAGCNDLVKNNKAVLLTDTEQLLEAMGWSINPSAKKNVQRELFIELTTEERTIVQLLQEKETMHIDAINASASLSNSRVAASILNLELQNVIVSLPGKMYRLA